MRTVHVVCLLQINDDSGCTELSIWVVNGGKKQFSLNRMSSPKMKNFFHLVFFSTIEMNFFSVTSRVAFRNFQVGRSKRWF